MSLHFINPRAQICLSLSVYQQICLGLNANEIQIPHDKHHKVSSLVKSHQNKHNSAGFVRVQENLVSPGILLWHFPGLESPGKRLLVLESSGNLLNSSKKNMKCMVDSKEN